jgi:Leucine-rich repeat (LRR) protein
LKPNLTPFPNRRLIDASNNVFTAIPDGFLSGVTDSNAPIEILLQNNDITGVVPVALERFKSVNIVLVDNKIDGIPESFCQKSDWMKGDVGRLGNDCAAILCPTSEYSAIGRATVDSPCLPCSDENAVATYLGQTSCSPTTSERMVLELLYVQTGGEHWSNNTNWLTSEPICSWENIVCTGNETGTEGVESIVLNSNNMIGTLPESVWQLPDLKVLNLRGNPNLYVTVGNATGNLEEVNLNGVMVECLDGISRATSLRELYAGDSGLLGTFPEEVLRLRDLVTLDLSWNFLIGTIPERIIALSSLQTLQLNYNDFHGTIPRALGHLSNLDLLDLSENLFSGPIPDQLSGMAKLRYLGLAREVKSGPELTGTLPSFDRLPNLVELTVAGNELTGTIPGNFVSSSVSAARINIADNRLSGPIPESLDELPSVHLALEGNQLDSIPPSFCDNSNWMNGEVGEMGDSCDAIACRPGTANPHGRESRDFGRCQDCDDGEAPFVGSHFCLTPLDSRFVLSKLFDETNGEYWHRSDYWKSDTDVCDWFGVGCDGSDVILLNLAVNNVSGTVPTEIFSLPQLKTLWLGSNPLDFQFKGIERAPRLLDLKLDSTRLSSLKDIGNAKSLTSLDVGFNKVAGRFPSELLKLPNLRVLSLRGNRLTGPVPSSFGDLRWLRYLRLDSNGFSGSLPSFSDSVRLTDIFLSKNKLTGSIPADFLRRVPMSANVTVDLSNNGLTGGLPAQLSRLQSLYIDLQGNEITKMDSSLCTKSHWMDGMVEWHGCDAILCAPGTSASLGRANGSIACAPCPTADASLYGENDCAGVPSSLYSSAVSLRLSASTLFRAGASMLLAWMAAAFSVGLN